MDKLELLSQTGAGLGDVLEQERATASEQLKAAWQLHVAQVEERLSAGWAEHIDTVVEERFRALANQIEEEFQRALASGLGALHDDLRREIGERLNQAVRRLRQSESDGELQVALLDAASGFAERTVLFTLDGEPLKVVGARGFDDEAEETLLRAEVPMASAPALTSAVESMDTVVAMRTSGELSEPLVGLLGEAPDKRAFLFPVISGQKTTAVLYAEARDQEVNTSALELLTSLAGLAVEARASGEKRRGEPLVTISVREQQPPTKPKTLPWAELSVEDQELHLRAQRFARVQVAEVRLYKAQAVQSGRAGHDLYAHLSNEIDSARQAFRLQFVTPCASMVDYLNLELVRTLANDDTALLGPEYPGPLV
jgi:hypothetical protein